jgi:hypothetical protein
LPLSLIAEIIRRPLLVIENEDALFSFISDSISGAGDFFSLLEFVRFECCSIDTMHSFVDLVWGHFDQLSPSIWASLCARFALASSQGRRLEGTVKQLSPPAPKQGQLSNLQLHGIIAYLTSEYGGHVHDRHIVEVTSGSFEMTTCQGPKPAKHVADMNGSYMSSPCRKREDEILHTRNNWVCYDFQDRRIVPTHYAMCSYGEGPGGNHPKSWVVETSADGNNWQVIDHQENNDDFNGQSLVRTFSVTLAGVCRFIRLVNIGRNHYGNDRLVIAAWEIFGSLLE